MTAPNDSCSSIENSSPALGHSRDHTSNLFSCAYSDMQGATASQTVRTKDVPGSTDTVSLPDLTIAGDQKHSVKLGELTKASITVDGKLRDVYLHVPKNYDPSKPMPLLVVFNGLGEGARGMENFTKLGEKAEKEGFIVAYPDGSGMQHSWNTDQSLASSANDIKFASQVIDSLSQDLNVDISRVSMAGFSQGGAFALRAANALSEKVAAVASVGGYMTGTEQQANNPLPELSIVHTQDNLVPFDGTSGLESRVKQDWDRHDFGQMAADGALLVASKLGNHFESAQYTTDSYRRLNGMEGQKGRISEHGNYTTAVWDNPTNHTQVEQITVNAPRGWDGSSMDKPLYEKNGTTTSDTDILWDFLKDKTRQNKIFSY